MTDQFENSELPDGGSNEESSVGVLETRSTIRPWIGVIALVLAAVAMLQQQEIKTRIAMLEAKSVPRSLFQPPADLDRFIDTIQASTVVIECGDAIGSGWVIDLGAPGEDADPEQIRIDEQFPTEVITNHHVIDECVDTPGKVKATANGTTYDAWLYSWDATNDLALVSIKQNVPALLPARKPKPGYWVMAVGSPYGLEGSVSIGNVINTDAGEVITTAPFNAGNSGSPLVNSLGRVVGTSTWSGYGDDYPQDWNVAEGIPLLCKELVDCYDSAYWSW